MDAATICPFCAESIPETAIVCPYCRSDLPSSEPPPVPPRGPAAQRVPNQPDALRVETPATDSPHTKAGAARVPRVSTIPRKAVAGGAGIALLGAATLIVLLSPDRTPATVELTGLPQVVLSYDSVRALPKARNKKAVELSDVSFAFSAEPPGAVTTVTADGTVRCLKRGDSIITVRAGSATDRSPLRCRPVARVSGPAEIALALGSKATRVDIVAFDWQGERYSDVPISMNSSDTSVFLVERGLLVPVSVGSAELEAGVGSQSIRVPVNVVEHALFQNFDLADGESRKFQVSLPGVYRVSVKAREEGDGKSGVTVAFGGTDCATRSESQAHDVSCSFDREGTIRVANPDGTEAPGTADPWRPAADLHIRLNIDRIKATAAPRVGQP